MYYLVDINNITVQKSNGDIYNFLDEMYYQLFELYCKKYFLEHISSDNKSIKDIKLKKINNEIHRLIELYNIPNKLLFEKVDNKFIEPITGLKFNLIFNNNFDNVSDEFAAYYIESSNKSPNNIISNVTQFNNIINNKQKTK